MTGPGRVGSRVTHRLQNVGRVGPGQSLCGSGRVGSRKSDPRPSLRKLCVGLLCRLVMCHSLCGLTSDNFFSIFSHISDCPTENWFTVL